MKRALAIATLLTILMPAVPSRAGVAGSTGNCRMRLIERQHRIRVRFVLRTESPGRNWRFKVLDERRRVFRGVFTTDGDGDFIVRTRILRRPGFRRYEGRATEIGTGVVCRVVLRT